MKRILIVAVIVLMVCTTGWAEQRVKVNGPFASYSHETFINNDTGETGLYIDGENWYAIINLKGFEDEDIVFSSPTEFFFKRNGKMIITAFAEEMRSDSDDKYCINKFVPKEYQKEISGKKVAVRDDGFGRESLNYYPYYKGYCFDFHFSFPAIDEKKVFDIIKTIKFVDGKFSNALTKKYFYTNTKRIELTVPSNWQLSYDKKASKITPTIKFLPKTGNNFEIMISPYGEIWGKPVSLEQVKKDAIEKFEQVAPFTVEKPLFRELKNKKVNMFYYCDLQDKDYKPSNLNDFPFLCQGFAEIEGSALYFTILYREKGGADVKNGIEVIKNSKILDLRK